MDAALASEVRERAGHAGEYCRMPEASYPTVPFPIDHIIARQHGGLTIPENLALSPASTITLTRDRPSPGSIPSRLAAFTFMTATQVQLAQANHHGALATCHPPYRTPSSAIRNRVHFACMISYEMLRFPGFLKISAGLVFVASQSSATTCIHVSLDSWGTVSFPPRGRIGRLTVELAWKPHPW